MLEWGEWVLLLELYRLRQPRFVSLKDPDLISLSKLLSARAPGRDAARQDWRSPDGLRARMSVFRVLDPDIQTRDTKRAALGAEVWARFWGDERGLHESAQAVRAAYIGETVDIALSARFQGFVPAQPSRGPPPSYGDIVLERDDGPTAVYVMLMTGPAERLLGVAPDQAKLLKVGRSNDLERRTRELNSGFPPGCGLTWRPLASVLLANGDEAERTEQALLKQLQAEGLTIGGEFARGHPEVVLEHLAAFGPVRVAKAAGAGA